MNAAAKAHILKVSKIVTETDLRKAEVLLHDLRLLENFLDVDRPHFLFKLYDYLKYHLKINSYKFLKSIIHNWEYEGYIQRVETNDAKPYKFIVEKTSLLHETIVRLEKNIKRYVIEYRIAFDKVSRMTNENHEGEG